MIGREAAGRETADGLSCDGRSDWRLASRLHRTDTLVAAFGSFANEKHNQPDQVPRTRAMKTIWKNATSFRPGRVPVTR